MYAIAENRREPCNGDARMFGFRSRRRFNSCQMNSRIHTFADSVACLAVLYAQFWSRYTRPIHAFALPLTLYQYIVYFLRILSKNLNNYEMILLNTAEDLETVVIGVSTILVISFR